jgi:uncharacterized membrane protein
MAFSCLIATTIMNRIGIRNSMILGSVCDCIQIMFCVFPALQQEYSNQAQLNPNQTLSNSTITTSNAMAELSFY